MVSSTPYVIYFCTRVLPHLGDMVLLDVDQKLFFTVLRLMADVTYHMKQIESAQAKACLTVVYNEVLVSEYLVFQCCFNLQAKPSQTICISKPTLLHFLNFLYSNTCHFLPLKKIQILSLISVLLSVISLYYTNWEANAQSFSTKTRKSSRTSGVDYSI